MASTEGTRTEKRSPLPSPLIPDKLYFRIGEVAKLLDLPTYVLRFWETEFPQLKPGKGDTGQRLYRRRDVELALRIRELLYDEGYTIPGARQHLKGESRASDTPTGTLPAPAKESVAASTRLRRMRSELREIASLLGRPIKTHPAKSTNRGLHMVPGRGHADVPRSAPLFPDDASSDDTPELP